MTYDPALRPSAREALSHEWIREGGAASAAAALQPEVLRRMKSFGAMNRFKRHAAMVRAAGGGAGWSAVACLAGTAV